MDFRVLYSVDSFHSIEPVALDIHSVDTTHSTLPHELILNKIINWLSSSWIVDLDFWKIEDQLKCESRVNKNLSFSFKLVLGVEVTTVVIASNWYRKCLLEFY